MLRPPPARAFLAAVLAAPFFAAFLAGALFAAAFLAGALLAAAFFAVAIHFPCKGLRLPLGDVVHFSYLVLRRIDQSSFSLTKWSSAHTPEPSIATESFMPEENCVMYTSAMIASVNESAPHSTSPAET